MSDIFLSSNKFNSNPFWDTPIDKIMFFPTEEDLDLFDQNGYDLTELEKRFCAANDGTYKEHRKHRFAIKEDWFLQGKKKTGAILNHSVLFERKGYSGDAFEQLNTWTNKLPLVHKMISMRPKWGLDFSMDYVDREGNCFEVLHWEWDSFSYDEIEAIRKEIEPIFLSIDWDDAGRDMLKKKSEWHDLDFFAQSDWKCNYFNIPKERFKMVIWK